MSFIKKLFNKDFFGATKRFPLPFLCILLLTILSINLNHKGYFFSGEQTFWILWILTSAALGLLGLKILFEAKEWHWYGYFISSAAFLVFCSWMIYGNGNCIYFLIFMLPGLFLFLYSSPYILKCDTPNDAIHRYTYSVSIVGLVAFVSALILFIGLQSIILTIDFLFKVSIGNRIQFDVAVFCWAFFAPLYAMASIPKDYNNRDVSIIPEKLISLFRLVIVPLLIVYMGILYAYFAMILYKGDLPKGVLTYITLSYSLVGIKAYLIVYFSKNKTKILELYAKYFFWLLLLPLSMLIWSIYQRVEQYGITPQRYAVVLIAAWIALFTLDTIIFRSHNLKRALSSLTIFFVLASCGPWSAYNVSCRSQIGRLEATLTEVKILQDGKLTEQKVKLSFEDNLKISDLLRIISSYNQSGFVRNWISQENILYKKPEKDWTLDDSVKALGIKFVEHYNNHYNIGFHQCGTSKTLLDISGFRYMGKVNFWKSTKTDAITDAIYDFGANGKIKFTVNWKKKTLSASINDSHTKEIDLYKIMDDVAKNSNKEDQEKPHCIYNYKIGSHELKIEFFSINAFIGKDEVTNLTETDFAFYLK